MTNIVLVSNEGDLLSKSLTHRLQRKNVIVHNFSPHDLGNLDVSLSDRYFSIGGNTIQGIFFRISPDSHFSSDFVKEDQQFCDAETRAVWLSALNLESIVTINRYDAVAWFQGIEWDTWRNKIIESEINVSSFVFGDNPTMEGGCWYPYSSSIARDIPGKTTRKILGCALSYSSQIQSNLVVCNHVITGNANVSVSSSSKMLERIGIQLAEITTDVDEHVVTINTIPKISNKKILKEVSEILVGVFLENMHSR